MSRVPNIEGAYKQGLGSSRPASPMVLGIIGLVWSVVTFVSMGLTMILNSMSSAPAELPGIDPAVVERMTALGYHPINITIGWAAGLLLCAGSIGLILYRKWGRRVIHLYGLAVIASLVVGLVNVYRVSSMPEATGAAPAWLWGSWIFGALTAVVYPTVAFFLLRRKAVSAALV